MITADRLVAGTPPPEPACGGRSDSGVPGERPRVTAPARAGLVPSIRRPVLPCITAPRYPDPRPGQQMARDLLDSCPSDSGWLASVANSTPNACKLVRAPQYETARLCR